MTEANKKSVNRINKALDAACLVVKASLSPNLYSHYPDGYYNRNHYVCKRNNYDFKGRVVKAA